MAANRERVVVAEILRPRGNRGEVLARSQTDVPGRIETLQKAFAQLADGSDISVEIAESWRQQGNWVLRFAGIDSIDAAERFRGADLWVAPEERPVLPEGEFFRSDLIGCSVMDRVTGKHLGTVEGWQQYGGPPLMEVKTRDREVLIPFTSPLCKVDLVAGIVQVDLPEGLLDL